MKCLLNVRQYEAMFQIRLSTKYVEAKLVAHKISEAVCVGPCKIKSINTTINFIYIAYY